MKIISAVGILRFVGIVIGLDAIIIGMFAALHCKAFGVYRRAFRDRMHMKTQGRGYEQPLDAEVQTRLMQDENETLHILYDEIYHPVGPHVTAWEHGNASSQAWAFILTYCVIVPLAFVISVTLFGFQIGKTEEEGCKAVVDLALHGFAAVLAIIGGALLICAAVIPDSAHKKDLEWDAKFLAFDIEEWKGYLERVDYSKADLKKTFSDNEYKNFKKAMETVTTRDQALKKNEEWGKKVLKRFEKPLQSTYRNEINFEFKIAGGALTIVYGIVLIATAVMIGFSLKKSKKVQPIAPPPPPPPPPVVEEVASEENPDGEGAVVEAASTDASAAES